MTAPMDKKTELNQFCQRLCQRPLSKNDILYQARKLGSQWQATVKLNCVDGQEYAGELKENQKEAEKSAAEQVLIAYADTVAKMGPSPTSQAAKKRKAATTRTLPGGIPLPGDEILKKAKTEDGEENPAMTFKVKINAVCMKLAKRGLLKGEIVYDCHQTQNGYQATVRLACLPDDWATKVWAGYECSTKQKAEQSAAEMALQTILADPGMGAEAQRALDPKPPPGEKKERPAGAVGGGSGKGKGKGKMKMSWDGDMMSMWNWMMGSMFGGGKGGGGKGGKGGKGVKSGPRGPNLPRERITEVAVTGEVSDWKDNYGWIVPHADLNHGKATERGGKVYVHAKDLGAGLESLEAGTVVQFHVYEDSSGLGAEEVAPF